MRTVRKFRIRRWQSTVRIPYLGFSGRKKGLRWRWSFQWHRRWWLGPSLIPLTRGNVRTSCLWLGLRPPTSLSTWPVVNTDGGDKGGSSGRKRQLPGRCVLGKGMNWKSRRLTTLGFSSLGPQDTGRSPKVTTGTVTTVRLLFQLSGPSKYK